jgi:outer membrane protein assembly factor BamE (lipoprotein component of BamABCDE complex)
MTAPKLTGAMLCLLLTGWGTHVTILGQATRPKALKHPVYEGLKIGVAKADQVKKTLGAPTRVDDFSAGTIEWIYLKPQKEVRQITVGLGDGILIDVHIFPERMTVAQAVRRFGTDYEVVRYNFDECESDGESAPLYESPDGDIQYLEYRSRGIYVSVSVQLDEVRLISYQSRPPGSPQSRCR